MRKQPLHRRLRVTVPSSQQRFLTPDIRESHYLQLAHGSFVEFGKSGRLIIVVGQFLFARLKAGAELLGGKLEYVVGWEDDWDIYFES